LPLQTPRQSDGQVLRVSAISQRPLPQTLGTKQSAGHESTLSVLLSQTESPHFAQSLGQTSLTSQTPSQFASQSRGQLARVSPDSQAPLPQKLPEVQSLGQLRLLSAPSQMPLPQVAVVEQSWGQVRALSNAEQRPSPQLAVVEQSRGQLVAVSLSSQLPSPQLARQSRLQVCPPSLLLQTLSPQKQSAGQVAEFSLSAQMPSPHSAASIGFSPSGARPHAPNTPAPAISSAPQRNNPTAERVRGMTTPIETRPSTRRKRRRLASVSFLDTRSKTGPRTNVRDRGCREWLR
jgi:hypothetical protein